MITIVGIGAIALLVLAVIGAMVYQDRLYTIERAKYDDRERRVMEKIHGRDT